MNLDDFGLIERDDLCGHTFGKESQAEIIGWSGRTSSRNKIYIYKCSKCSLDSEMFGEGYFKGLKSNLTKGSLSCGCGKSFSLTEHQQAIRAQRKASDLGVTFIGWAEPYKDITTKMVMLCCEHGLWNTTRLTSMLTIGHSCPRCSASKSSERERAPERLVVDQIKSSVSKLGYEFIDWSEEYKGKATKCRLLCEQHGMWETTPANSIIYGATKVGCPTCSKELIRDSRLVAEIERVQQLHDIASERCLEFLGVIGDFDGVRSKIKLRCPKHGEWSSATINSFMRGSSCPSCNGHNQKQCYVNIIYDNFLPVAIKFGVAQDFESRVWGQNNKSPLEVVNHSAYVFDNSENCKGAEREIKKSVVCGVLERDSFPDGYTETTFLHNIDLILNIFEKYGGKCI